MKHEELLSKLTPEEKAALLSGKTVWQTRDIPRLKIPSIFLSDGPHGIRKQAGAGDHLGLNASLKATCFPTAATIANSWDPDLGEEIGKALGEEAAAQDVNIVLGPGLNMKRSPLCGRNFEYFSEDPYLAGKMAAAYVRGIQSQGVYACPKHFAVNSQEERRMAMDAVVDERTLREIYLTGFEIAVKEGHAKAIMTSYNEVNEEYANENKKLLVDILRKEWGFDGLVVTDWGGSNDHVKGVMCQSDLEMPAPGLSSARELVTAVKEGCLSMEAFDLCVDQVLDAVLNLSKKEETKNERYCRVAVEAAKQCGRGVLPDVALPLPNFGAVCRSFDQYDLVLFCYECGGAPLRQLLVAAKPANGQKLRLAIVTGAEGGFAAEEAEMAAKAGAKTVGLGPRILRCETAPLAVLSAVMTLTGNLE